MTSNNKHPKREPSSFRQRETILRETAAATWHLDRASTLMELIRAGANGRAARDQRIIAEHLGPNRELPTLEVLQAEYREAHAKLYSRAFLDEVEKLKRREPTGIEYVLAYLEADPWHFRSGYLKSDLVRYLRRLELTENERERLRAVIIAAWQKGPRSDYKEYLRLARVLDSPAFRVQLERLAASEDASTASRARSALHSMRHSPRI